MRSPRAIANGSCAEVGEQHLHLAAVVAVDGAGAVEHGDAVAQREP